MSCAACSARVEKAVKAVPGAENVSVNLLTNSMTVDGKATSEEIIAAVKKAGYGAKKQGAKEEKRKDTDTAPLKVRLISSAILLVILMYFSMGHMFSLPLPAFFDGNPVANGIVQLILTGIITFINRKFFISGFKGVIHGAANMDTLVSLGSGAAFLYSLYSLFMMTDAQASGNFATASGYLHELYFESAAMILTLITVGKTLEAYSKGRATDAIKELMSLSPDTATVIRDGKETEIPVEEVRIGDVFVVRPGGKIPVDGVVIEGSASIDESALTGESLPIDKAENSEVSAATVNLSGFIKCRAVRVGEDTALSRIIKTVKDATAAKAPIAKIADKVSGIFVPTVVAIAIVTAAVWLILGSTFGYALSRAISVLVISCPCALGLATPVAIMVGSGVGAKHGILFKTAAALEETGKIKTVALDKTGTVTEGKPKVTDVIAKDENALLTVAASLEVKSEHPLASAVVAKAEEEGLTLISSEDFEIFSGNGLKAKINGKEIVGGNYAFVKGSEKYKDEYEKLSAEGKTPLFFSEDGEILGIIAVADTIKHDSAEAIERFSDMNIKTVMLTGDNERTAAAIASKTKITEVRAGILPSEKAEEIEKLQSSGKVAMVGDGINDAPALTKADVGIAIGAGTDIAISSADVVLIGGSINDAVSAIKIGRATLRNIKENLFWAFFYNALGIPLAAGVFTPIFGWSLNPMFAAAAMSLSSFCVVTNALRLNFIKLKNKTEVRKMTVKIEGMMCGHCKAHVEEALAKLGGVESFEVSLEKKEATVNGSVAADAVKAAIVAAGYTVTEITE